MKLDWPYSKSLACAGDVVDGSKCHVDDGAHDLIAHFGNKLLPIRKAYFFQNQIFGMSSREGNVTIVQTGKDNQMDSRFSEK